MDDAARIGRRQFAQGVVAGAAGLTISFGADRALASDDKPAPPAENKADQQKEEKPADAAEKPDVPPEFLLLSYLLRQYPNDQFDKDAVMGVFRDIRGDVARGRILQDFPLKNSDEPAFVFRVFRTDAVRS